MDRRGWTDRARWLRLGGAIALLGLSLFACAAGTRPSCRWRLGAIRPPTSDERPFIDKIPLLADPASANDVPGPDSLRFVVRKVTGHKPGIFLEDRRSGRSELLLAQASEPRPSPDGRSLACTIWQSTQRPWTLVVLDLATRKLSEPALDGCAGPFAWSPDGKWIAVMVSRCQTPQSRLAIVSMPSQQVRWVDSLDVFSDYEFGWSPDSRHLAVVRPTALDPNTEEPTASELWIFSDGGRQRCRLDTPSGCVHREPRWVTNRAILVESLKQSGQTVVEQGRVVLEVSEDGPR